MLMRLLILKKFGANTQRSASTRTRIRATTTFLTRPRRAKDKWAGVAAADVMSVGRYKLEALSLARSASPAVAHAWLLVLPQQSIGATCASQRPRSASSAARQR